MAAKRIAQSSVNWGLMAEKVGDSQRHLFNAFKAKSDLYLRRVLANPENPPAIDWAFYKQRITVPGLVESFQKQYESLKIEYPADKVSHEIDAQQKKAEGAVAQFVSASNSKITEYQAELQKWKQTIPFNQMTMEDFKDMFPEKALDPLNKPTWWPHTEDVNPPEGSEAAKAHGH